MAQDQLSAIEEAFEAAQWASLSAAGKALQQLGLREASGSPELAALVRKRQDLAGNVTALEATIASGGIDATTAVRLRGEIDSMRAEIAAIDTRLAADFPRYAEFASPRPASVADVQGMLRADEAMLFYFTTDTGTFAWAIDREAATWTRAALWDEYLADEIARLRADLDPHARSRGAITLVEGMDRPRVAPFDRTTAYFLYTQLIEPLEPVLAGKRHVFVVADGPLGGLPLSVLISERPAGADTDPDALRETAWLAKRFAVTTLPTVASLGVVRAEYPATTTARERFVGVGAPVLGQDVPDEAPVPVPGGAFFRGVLADVTAVRALPSLPQTGPELRRLAATLGASDDSLILGAAATETTLKARDLSSVDVIAFATHGLLTGELTGLAEPALVLTPPDAASVDDDGLLTASEVANLRLSADWVILSACNTAGGDGRPDAEGLSGLARAFLYAGARSILVSHWPVRDDAAARLTTEAIATFDRGDGTGRSEALRRAMLQVMRDERDPSLAHPSAWAPFVVVGEGGA